MKHLPIFAREFENEVLITRKFLSILPEEKFDWKPHPKSMSLRDLATHIAELPSWIVTVFDTTELDFTAAGNAPAPLTTLDSLLSFYENNVAQARAYLNNPENESKLQDYWVLRTGSTIHSNQPKAEVIRMCFNQTVHHRAQLGVFLRLLNIPIPGTYGPSADELY
ncbi:DinB family protein [Niabella digestorum]|jgi:Uncharacterized protein conserved in bacteria|uniref:DinB family protein n=1 Tax=Niabella digestorum TaxID=3117701 RepID=A0ABU7RDY8_9BACT